MRKLLLLILSLFVMQFTFGQLSGTKTIPGDYATIEAAVAALNSQGVGSGGVTFNVAAGHTETITAVITLTATGTVANPIIFQKSGGGANPLITANVGANTPSSAVQDGIWALSGSDYVTIDGIDLYDPNAANPATMEYGYGLFKAAVDNGCRYNTIKNCVVTLNRENNASGSGPAVEGSKAIQVTNATLAAQTTSVTPTVPEGTNSNNMFYGNTLQNCNYGIVLSGYAASTPFTLGDTGNDVGGSGPSTGNTIINFGGATSASNPAAGIRANNQWGVNISYNTINNNNGSGVNHVSTLRGIFAQAGTSANATINYNNLTIKGGATTSQVAMIENAIGSTAAGNTVTINNNTLTGEYLTATSGAFYGIYNTASAATVNMSNNSILNLVYSANSLAGSGSVYLIYNTGAATVVNASGNTISNISRFGNTGSTTIGIYFSSGTTQNVTNNLISNLSIDGTGTGSTMYGIQTSTGTIAVNNNEIHTLTCIKTSGTGVLYGIYNISSPTNENYNNNIVRNLTHNGTGTVYGIYAFTTTGVRTMSYNTVYNLSTAGTTIAGINNTSSSPNIFNNKVYSIQSTSTGAPTVSGILLGSLGTSGVANIYNNLIGDIKAPAANSSGPTAPSVRGINVTTTTTTTTINISFNTVHLNAVSTGALFSTAGLYVASSATATTAALALRNNIIVNKSTPAGTGLSVAYQRSTTDLANFASSSNNNLFYAGTPDASRVIFYNGTTAYQTLDSYKVLVAPRESASITEDPNFLSLNGAAADFLHINPAIGTQIEGSGITISGITTDFDNQTRNVTTPDIGADEFNGVYLDSTPPSISYTPLINVSEPGERILNATITDPSGVPTTGIGLPVLYWRINAGSWNAATGTYVSGNTYTFTFGGGAVIGDMVYYYIAAQDMAASPNTGCYPSAGAGGFSVNPPAAATPPTTPSSYGVMTPLSGNYTVGVTLFNSITGKNITFEKSVRTVMKEVDVEVYDKGDSDVESTETAIIPKSKKQVVPVEEVTYIPMENGRPYTGQLYVEGVQVPGFETRETMGVYATITAALADLTLRGVSGPVNFLLTDATYPTETFPLVVSVYNTNKPTATNFVTLKPSTGVTASITGASPASQIFKILESHFVLDGSNSGGSDRSLTLENTSATTPQVVVVGSTGTTPITNVTVKNCNIINGVTSSSALIVSDGTTPGTAGYFTNITVQNNTIQKAYIGAYCNAVVAAGNGNGLVLTQNNLAAGGTNQIRLVGLYVQGVDGATVSNNILGNMANTSDASNVNAMWFATGTINSSMLNNTISTMSGTSMGPRGLAASTGNANSNIIISGNIISGITTTSTTAPYGIYVYSSTGRVSIIQNRVSGLLNSNTGGYGARGILLTTGLTTNNSVIANNVVYDIVCTGDAGSSFWGIGIAIDGTTGGVGIYHNSVNLYGSYAGYTTATITSAFFNGASTTNLDVRNNIFVNSFDNTTVTTDKAYAINSAAANTAFSDINYNDYFVSGTPGVLGYLTSDRLTLTDWQTATGKDANSYNTDPLFVSATDLHPASTLLDNTGTYLANVPIDFSGAVRTNPPDIGAFEFGTNPVILTTAATGLYCAGGNLNGTINANGLIVDSYFDYGPTLAYGSTVAGTPANVTGTTDVPVTAAISMPVSTTWHYRLRGVTSAGVTVYGNDMSITSTAPGAPQAMTLNATNIASYTATLNGSVNASCDATTVTFEYGETASYGLSAPADQSPVSGSDFQAVSANIGGLIINTLYHFRVVASNSSGTVYGADQTFETGAAPPEVVTNPATNVGNFTATFNGTVDANNQDATVSFEYGLSNSYGSTIAGVPAIVSGDVVVPVTANVSGLAYNTTYHFRCVSQNAAGITYGNDQVFTTLCPVPEAAGTITGPVSVCQATSGHVYTVPPINYAYNGYVWSLPAGGTITAGAGTNSITVSYSNSAVTGNVTVYGTSVCGNGTASSLPVTINPLPVPVISGPIVACITHTYTYTTATGMTGYVWNVSAGGQIMSGAGTSSITVKWNSSGSQWVSASYTSQSGCPAASPTVLNVSVGTLTSPTIAGSELMCVNSGWHVYTTQQGYSNYVWTVTSGGTIVSGQGTYQIEVNWTGAGSQSVSVNYANTYGCSANTPTTFGVTVMGLPGNAGPITGTHEFCEGTMGVTYSVNTIPNTVTYNWTVPAGAIITDGAGTSSIKVDFPVGASSGDIRVQGENLCGTGQFSPPFNVTVNPIPPTPVASVDEFFMLHSSAPEGNQWYFNGTLIEGATGQDYQAEEEGFYWTIVTLEGCVSDESNHVEVIFVGLNEPGGSGLTIHPVPNNGRFVATINIPGEHLFTIMVYNDLGMKMYEKTDIRVNGKTEQAIDLNSPATGVYTVILQGNNQTVIRKILITR